MVPSQLALGVALFVFAISSTSANASTEALSEASKLDTVQVQGAALPEPRFEQIPAEISDGKVLAAKKATRIDFDDQPTVQDGNLRTLFARVPGVLVSELAAPGIFNLNYRGLGDPHESEFINVLENGLPVASDWIGYPTVYYFPPSGRVARMDFVRGGSGLLYGPQIGPSINLVTRQPVLGSGFGGRSEHIVGRDSLYQTFSEVSYGGERFAVLADFEHRESDGPRDNADYGLDSGRLLVDYRPTDDSVWQLEYLDYRTESGEPGRLTSDEFATDRDLVKTPFNRLFIDSQAIRLRNQTRLNDYWTAFVQVGQGTLDRLSRRSSAFVDPANAPSSANIDRQRFRHDLFDARLAGEFERHSLTTGVTLYRDDSPRERFRSDDIVAGRGGTPLFAQERETRYAAVFAEAVLRFGDWSVVPGLRYDDVQIEIDEPLLAGGLTRAPIDETFKRSEPLFSLGVMRELGHRQQVYANASTSYRPTRFDDVANPSSNLSPDNRPEAARGSNIELGLRGSPVKGLYYDASLFRIDFDDKIEQLQLSPSDILRVNSGDARHQGAEFAVEYDFLNAFHRDDSLLLFASLALLDADIVASQNAALVGNTPAFAPERILRLGAAYRGSGGSRIALTAHHVSSHFWSDSNQGSSSVEARIPSYAVVDFNLELPLTRHIELLGGINNLFDADYYSRVRSDGIEPAAGRSGYIGARIRF